jgi:hemoglobin-like flavoprotein
VILLRSKADDNWRRKIDLGNGRRKMLAARDDLADKIGKIAQKRGFTLFGMVNELLELAIKVDNMGVTLKEAVDAYELAKNVKDASFTLVLESLLYDTTEIAYKKASEETLKKWHDAGTWISQRYIARGQKDPLDAYEQELRALGWNIPGISIERSGKTVSIQILSPRFSDSYTTLFNRYLEGFLEGSGYKITFNEVGKGNIRLEAVKRGVDGNR